MNSGKDRKWYKSGQLESEYSYTDGVQDGVNKRYHENGQLSLEQTYKMMYQIGVSRSWNEDGLLLESTNYNNNGKLDGLEIKWSVTEINIRKRSSEIMWEIGPSGYSQKKYSKSWHVDVWNDISEGEFGQLAEEIHYIDGQENGKNKAWAPNGQIIRDCIKKNHDPTGPYKEWYNNGQIKIDGNYLEPSGPGVWVKDGMWKEWWENGIMNIDSKYDKGNVLYYKRWERDGILLEER